MYLKDRRSVVLNHNPFIVFHQDPNDSNNHQVKTFLKNFNSKTMYSLVCCMMYLVHFHNEIIYKLQ